MLPPFLPTCLCLVIMSFSLLARFNNSCLWKRMLFIFIVSSSVLHIYIYRYVQSLSFSFLFCRVYFKPKKKFNETLFYGTEIWWMDADWSFGQRCIIYLRHLWRLGLEDNVRGASFVLFVLLLMWTFVILMLLLWMKSMLPTVAGTAFFPWCPSQQSVCLCAYICVLYWRCVCVCAHDHVCAFHYEYEYGYYCFFVWLHYTIDFYVGICTVNVFLKLGCKVLWVSESTL